MSLPFNSCLGHRLGIYWNASKSMIHEPIKQRLYHIFPIIYNNFVSRQGGGSPRERTRWGFLDTREATFGLSRFAIWAWTQRLPLNRPQKPMISREKKGRLLSGKRNNNSKDKTPVVKTGSSESMVKASLKLSHQVNGNLRDGDADLLWPPWLQSTEAWTLSIPALILCWLLPCSGPFTNTHVPLA